MKTLISLLLALLISSCSQKNNLNYAYLDIQEPVNERAFDNYIKPIVMKSHPGWSSIPIVFNKGKFIGGFDDLVLSAKRKNKNVQMSSFRKFMSSSEIVVHKYIPEDFDY